MAEKRTSPTGGRTGDPSLPKRSHTEDTNCPLTALARSARSWLAGAISGAPAIAPTSASASTAPLWQEVKCPDPLDPLLQIPPTVSAYSTELYVLPVAATLLCSICQDVVKRAHAIDHDECEHVFCLECLEAHLESTESPNCPECRRPASSRAPVASPIINRQVRNLRMVCPGKQRGCPWTGVQHYWQAHWDSCPTNMAVCPVPGCGVTLPFLSQAAHVQNDCLCVAVECPNACGLVPMQNRASMNEHVDTTCPKQVLKCDYCDDEVQRQALEQHRRDNTERHVSTLFQKLTEQREEATLVAQAHQADLEAKEAEIVRLQTEVEKCIRVAKDVEQAVFWWRKAADRGHAQAQFQLGLAYAHGEGVPKDPACAVGWWIKSAEKGHVESMYKVACAHCNGAGVEKDSKTSLRWLSQAAERGHPGAQYCFGCAHYHGFNVTKDPLRALYWWRKSADQGNADALYHLGCAYEEGVHIPKDHKQALHLIRKAAVQGHTKAQQSVLQMSSSEAEST